MIKANWLGHEIDKKQNQTEVEASSIKSKPPEITKERNRSSRPYHIKQNSYMNGREKQTGVEKETNLLIWEED